MNASEQSLGEVFVALSDSLQDGHDVVDTMDVLVEAATSFTSADEAGIVLADYAGGLHVIASTSARAIRIDEEQLAPQRVRAGARFAVGKLSKSQTFLSQQSGGRGLLRRRSGVDLPPHTPCRSDTAPRSWVL